MPPRLRVSGNDILKIADKRLQHDEQNFDTMIVSGTYPSIHVDLGSNEPGMTLQYRQIERGYIVWRDYTVDGEVVRSPVDIDGQPDGVYRMV